MKQTQEEQVRRSNMICDDTGDRCKSNSLVTRLTTCSSSSGTAVKRYNNKKNNNNVFVAHTSDNQSPSSCRPHRHRHNNCNSSTTCCSASSSQQHLLKVFQERKRLTSLSLLRMNMIVVFMLLISYVPPNTLGFTTSSFMTHSTRHCCWMMKTKPQCQTSFLSTSLHTSVSNNNNDSKTASSNGRDEQYEYYSFDNPSSTSYYSSSEPSENDSRTKSNSSSGENVPYELGSRTVAGEGYTTTFYNDPNQLARERIRQRTLEAQQAQVQSQQSQSQQQVYDIGTTTDSGFTPLSSSSSSSSASYYYSSTGDVTSGTTSHIPETKTISEGTGSGSSSSSSSSRIGMSVNEPGSFINPMTDLGSRSNAVPSQFTQDYLLRQQQEEQKIREQQQMRDQQQEQQQQQEERQMREQQRQREQAQIQQLQQIQQQQQRLREEKQMREREQQEQSQREQQQRQQQQQQQYYQPRQNDVNDFQRPIGSVSSPSSQSSSSASSSSSRETDPRRERDRSSTRSSTSNAASSSKKSKSSNTAPNPLGSYGDMNAQTFQNIDFDAPLYRRKAVGNVVRSPPYTSRRATDGSTTTSLQPNDPVNDKRFKLNHDIVVDDECYLGKDLNQPDCVDFDPPKVPANRRREVAGRRSTSTTTSSSLPKNQVFTNFQNNHVNHQSAYGSSGSGTFMNAAGANPTDPLQPTPSQSPVRYNPPPSSGAGGSNANFNDPNNMSMFGTGTTTDRFLQQQNQPQPQPYNTGWAEQDYADETAATASYYENEVELPAGEEEEEYVTKKEAQEMVNEALKNFCQRLFDTADNLARAMDSVPKELRRDFVNHPELANLYAGINMADDALTKALKSQGLEKCGKLGDEFDPNYHQALFEVDDPTLEEGTLGQIIKVGFVQKSSNDKKVVVRCAEVGVVKERSSSSSSSSSSTKTTSTSTGGTSSSKSSVNSNSSSSSSRDGTTSNDETNSSTGTTPTMKNTSSASSTQQEQVIMQPIQDENDERRRRKEEFRRNRLLQEQQEQQQRNSDTSSSSVG